MPRAKWVDERVETTWDKAAEELLATNSDEKFLTQNGVVAISKERWRSAQRYEEFTWMRQCTGAASDRNEDYQQKFNHYALLRDLGIAHATELGCGPFTNMRLIIQNVPSIMEVALIDPLLNTYLEHPHCQYKLGLEGVQTALFNQTAEEYRGQPTDLVVLVNVLEHCFDIGAIFDTVDAILKPGGAFVFSDMKIEPDVLKEMVATRYNAGHPLRSTPAFLESRLANFDELFRIEEQIRLSDELFPATEVWFIGKKKQGLADIVLTGV